MNLRNALLAFVVLAFAVGSTACGGNDRPTQTTPRASGNSNSNTATATANAEAEAVAHSSLFSTEDFDLPYIIDLIQQDVTVEDIQSIVNDPEYAITNVDVLPCTENNDGSRTCGDGNVDFVLVREDVGTDSFRFDFMAYATPPEDPDSERSTNIASVNITRDSATGTATVEGVYPEYAQGHQSSYYRNDGLSLGEAYLLASLLRPGYTPFGYSYGYWGPRYAPAPVYAGGGSFRNHARSNTASTRSVTTTRQTTTVTPRSRPASVSSSPRATTTQSRLANSRTTSTNSRSLSGNSGTGRSFGTTSSQQRSTRGSAFGGGTNQTGVNAAAVQQGSQRATSNTNSARTTRPSASQAAGNANRTSTSRATGSSTARQPARNTTRSNSSRPSTRSSSSSRSRSSFGGGSRSSSSSRRSLAEYKVGIEYLDDADLAVYAAALDGLALTTWQYRNEPGQDYLGIIIDDAVVHPALDGTVIHGDEVDLYGLASLNIAANQQQNAEIAALRAEIDSLRAAVESCH